MLLLLTGGIQPRREDSAWHARRQRPRSDHSGCIGSTDRFFCRPRRLLRPNSICHMGSETRYVWNTTSEQEHPTGIDPANSSSEEQCRNHSANARPFVVVIVVVIVVVVVVVVVAAVGTWGANDRKSKYLPAGTRLLHIEGDEDDLMSLMMTTTTNRKTHWEGGKRI